MKNRLLALWLILLSIFSFALSIDAAQISRVKDAEISNGNAINADDLDAEYNSLVNESNSQDTRLTNIESNAMTIAGVKTFSSAPKLNQIDENTSGAGVTVDGVKHIDGYVNLGSIRATISSVDTGTEIITTAANHGLSTGDKVYIRALSGGTIPGGTSASTLYFARAPSTTTLSLHVNPADATNNANLVNITSAQTGSVQIISDPSSPAQGDFWQGAYLKGSIGGTSVMLATPNGVALSRGYHGSAAPIYASAATFTMARIVEKSADNTIDIIKTSSTTVDISTTGLNGVAQSAALTGTVAVTNGSAAVTGTGTALSTDFAVGDVICVVDTSECRRVTVAGGATSLTVESNFTVADASSTFKRGGEAPNTWYNVYAITDEVTPGLILSPRNVAGGGTLTDLPTGYSTSTARQLPFAVRNAGTSNFLPWFVVEGWPYRPKVLYEASYFGNSGDTNFRILNGGTQTAYTDVDASTFVPPISKVGLFHISASGTAGTTTLYVRQNGSSNDGIAALALFTGAFQALNSDYITIQTDSSQVVEYKMVSPGAGYIHGRGFVVTEVN